MYKRMNAIKCQHILGKMLNPDHSPEKFLSEKVTFLGQQILAIERLKNVEQGQTAEFVKEQRNQNTVRKTDGDIKLFAQWLIQSKKEKRDILTIPAGEVDKMLAMFVLNVKKVNGEQYWQIPEGNE